MSKLFRYRHRKMGLSVKKNGAGGHFSTAPQVKALHRRRSAASSGTLSTEKEDRAAGDAHMQGGKKQ